MSKATTLALIITSLVAAPSALAYEYGQYADTTLDRLINDYPGRYRGTANFEGASDWMQARLGSGYALSRQPFSWVVAGASRSSQNVIATAAGVTGRSLVVGAHFDTFFGRPTLQGLDDNGSGAAVLTEIARNLSGLDLEDGLTFLAFGAEEEGLRGSRAYVSSLDAEARASLTGMINIDSLITGDKMYAHAGGNSIANPALASLREHAFRIAEELGIELFTNPGLDPAYPIGTGCCSDGDSFNAALAIPVLYLESTNWEIGDLDGYTQTTNPAIPGGATWHNPALDNEAVLVSAFGRERIDQRLRDYSRLLTRLVLEATNTDLRYSTASAAHTMRAVEEGLARQHQNLGQLHERRWLLLQLDSREVGSFDGAIGAEGGANPSGGFDDGVQGRARHAGIYALGDYQISPTLNIGASLSYGGGKQDLQHGGKIESDTWQAGVYAQLNDGGPLWLNADLRAGRSDLDLTRSLVIQGNGGGPVVLNQRLSGDTDATFWGGRLLTGYDFSFGQLRSGPLAGIEYTRYVIDGFTEKQALRTALDYQTERYDSVELSLGWRAYGDIEFDRGLKVQPYASLAWVEELGDGFSDSFSAVSRGDGATRTTRVSNVDKHFARAQVGAQLAINESLGLYAEANGRLQHDDGEATGFLIGAQWAF
ncbi:autotransporter domain-containing protein [Stutzerimonas zhaodongensis]|uniref:autotransporter domain-containing protein n=1 Tax=Stutzerimonas zhaodongensis TaxID=1176257 RepID=UPI001FC973DA|nr:autotransporter domain-containing protein [Stutzerimonas zhaodongensis]MCQ4316457.1 autotransporter domain-containing protein [Stutzerimonas zhaodongensis]